MKKKLLAAILAGAMVLAMTACGGNSQKQEEAQIDAQENDEASEEIMDAPLGEYVLQVGKEILQFPMTMGDFAAATGAEWVDPNEAVSEDRKIGIEKRDFKVDCTLESLEDAGRNGSVTVRTKDGSYFYMKLAGDGNEAQACKDMYIYEMHTGSDHVFIARGIHTGMFYQDVEKVDGFEETEKYMDADGNVWVTNTAERTCKLIDFASIYVDLDDDKVFGFELKLPTPIICHGVC